MTRYTSQSVMECDRLSTYRLRNAMLEGLSK